ncbi:hypothetical protein ACFVUS_23990 [Nocardia sp. NPDC058058]|uniref:hypothetical protein n=1 Tax=Nocardia sp. NPDC058058 TaxID=3346317 RepID=UPI0036DBCC45
MQTPAYTRGYREGYRAGFKDGDADLPKAITAATQLAGNGDYRQGQWDGYDRGYESAHSAHT